MLKLKIAAYLVAGACIAICTTLFGAAWWMLLTG